MRSFFWTLSRFFHSSYNIWQVVIAHFIRGIAWNNSPEEIEEHRFQRWMTANHLCMEWRHGFLVSISAWNAAKDCSEQSFHKVQVEMSENNFSIVCWYRMHRNVEFSDLGTISAWSAGAGIREPPLSFILWLSEVQLCWHSVLSLSVWLSIALLRCPWVTSHVLNLPCKMGDVCPPLFFQALSFLAH